MIDMPDWIRRSKDTEPNKNYIRVPEESTFLGQVPDTRVMLRNVVFDAMLGSGAEKVLEEKYEMLPMSPEGREQLVRDSRERLGKVVGSFAIVDSVAEAVASLFVDMSSIIKDVPEDVRDIAVEAQADLLRRCTIATLSALVDLGFFTPNFESVEVKVHDEQ